MVMVCLIGVQVFVYSCVQVIKLVGWTRTLEYKNTWTHFWGAKIAINQLLLFFSFGKLSTSYPQVINIMIEYLLMIIEYYHWPQSPISYFKYENQWFM